ncbi:MAG TPA: MG2 domain-containing protein [Lacipirellulaceae bacterium]|nr:MG2 domain-containing protein [Lacipirellulaceae bacterium]
MPYVKLLAAALISLSALALAQPTPATSEGARKLSEQGNYQEALEQFRALTLPDDGDLPEASPADLIQNYRGALACYQQLNRVHDIDEYREAVVAAYPRNWRLLADVGRSYLEIAHHGYLIAGKVERGDHRGGGELVHVAARDRVRALQLFKQAFDAIATAEERTSGEASALLTSFAGALMHGGYHEAWRLQVLTDLETLPDHETGWGYYGGEVRGAPVDAEGVPIYYDVPDSWEAARNDGERWRWLLATRTRWQPDSLTAELTERAQFLHSQFSVRTMADYGWWFARQSDAVDVAKSTFDLRTLGEDETMARLATGIKRFKLPEEHNYIALWRRVVEATKDRSPSLGEPVPSLAALAAEFEDRQQFARAAEIYKQITSRGPLHEEYRARYQQIVGNWGRFEPTATQRAGRGATLDYRFRNGRRVEFTAQPIAVRRLLADLKAYLASSPRQLEWNQLNVEQLGHKLVTEGQEKYLGAESARWSLDLEPRAEHFDRRVTVTTPLQKAGAYLVTAKMEGGNTHQIVVWIADTAIVKKPLPEKALYYVADAVTGQPLPGVNVEFFGYWQEHLGNGRFAVHTKNFAELTDANGLVELSDGDNRHQWIAIASTPAGDAPLPAPGDAPAATTSAAAPPAARLAFLGYSSVWSGAYYDPPYEQVKVFAITDRPVYRPDQDVHFKFWVANAKFDQPDASPYAAQSFVVEITNPRGEKVLTQTLVADAYGGLAGTYKLPPGATLGQYQFHVVNHGGGSFRVEEYKKPEYEVTIDAPSDPVKLGDTISATIKANYYFGAPVTNARVKYKVLRSSHTGAWRPPGPWDWLYGPGYWWFSEDYAWYPGWARWGCPRPAPSWFWQAPAPPEVVAEAEADIGPDGTLPVKIDTGPAKEFHPDQDHSYEIQAEVVDESRRAIVATGNVLVAREPFRVYVWATRGYYRAGQTIELEMAARTIDGKPVEGDGVVRLLRIAYEEGKPVENEVARWTAPTDSQGRATLQLKASDPGQYRIAYEVTSQTASGSTEETAPQKIEGGQLLVVRGEGFDGTGYRFNAVELTPDRREYAPGDKVRLQVSANRLNAAVLLFLRPANGVYLPPQVVRLTGKSQIVELDVTAADMPNFFVEAVAVHGGKVHTAVREIIVPPSKRVFNVEVEPSAKEYLPGQNATVRFKLTDSEGKPLVGSTVVAIYDKALDYIAGSAGSADIREFFWKWRRAHHAMTETSLDRAEAPVAKNNDPTMQNVGVFGESSADQSGGPPVGRFSGGVPTAGVAMGRGGGAMNKLADAAMPMSAAAAESSAMAADGGAAATVEPTIRQEFADTALWVGALETDQQGIGEVELKMPQNLTTWKVNVWSMGRGTRVGQGSAEVVTRKNIIVRMQAPRFFVEKDEAVLSANVHNYLKTEKQVRVRLELEGGALAPLGADGPSGADSGNALERVVTIAPGGEQRVDWRVRAAREGDAIVRMSALTDEESDAMQMTFPVLVHGMLKTQSYAGVLRPDDATGGFTFSVPQQRRAEQTRLELRYSPTLAGSMVDALPYLADFPYGCTEQTLNRFLPAVLTQRTLQRMGVDLKAIREKRTNLNAQEIGDDAERAAQWKRYQRNPVFDEAELDAMVKAGVNRLTEMQLSDGGWGWFSGWGESSSPHTTAIVVRGLVVAQTNGVALVPGVVERGVQWLRQYEADQLAALDNYDREAQQRRDKDKPFKAKADDVDALVYLVLAEAQSAGAHPAPLAAGGADPHARMRQYLYGDRTALAVYSLATFGLALQTELQPQAAPAAGEDATAGRREMLSMILRNLSQYVVQDDENQTAWLDLPGQNWWYWYGSEYEAHAFYLKLLAAAEPKSEVASRMVKYLLNNRKNATYWNSTRDTALVVEAFADYLAASGELQPNLSLDVLIDGKRAKTVEITADTLFSFDNSVVLSGEELAAGDHVVEFRKTGDGPIYFNGYLENFTLEDDIQATGLELKVARRYYKLTHAEKTTVVAGARGQAIEQQLEKYDRTPIAGLEELASGDLVEVELLVDSKNDYEYIVLEDMKASGFEPVEVRSGYNGNALGAYVEYRDQRVALFCRTLARGQHSVAYRLRAETPGRFSALPTKAMAMYAPELRANSDEWKVRIVE